MSWAETYGTAEEYLAKLLPLLEEKGAALLVAEYAGGEGSGGVENVCLLARVDSEDDPVEVEYTAASATSPGGYPLLDLCNSIVTTHFGSWVGDWSAEGSLFVDVAAKRCWKVGRMRTWAADGDELDVALA